MDWTRKTRIGLDYVKRGLGKRELVKRGLDWTRKWTGLCKTRLVKRELVKRGLVSMWNDSIREK